VKTLLICVIKYIYISPYARVYACVRVCVCTNYASMYIEVSLRPPPLFELSDREFMVLTSGRNICIFLELTSFEARAGEKTVATEQRVYANYAKKDGI
jgi:hypothetical protein